MNRLLATTLLVGLAAAPRPAAATGLSLGADVAFVRDGSFDAIAYEDLLDGLDLALDYTVLASAVVHLEVEAGYGFAGTDGANADFVGLAAAVNVHEIHAGVRLATVLADVEWLRPYARVRGGVVLGHAAFAEAGTTGQGNWEALGIGGAFYAGGGLEFLLPSSVYLDDPDKVVSEPFSFGFFVEGGYRYRSPLALSAETPVPDDPDEAADRIPLAWFDAGDVDLSGALFRAGLVVRI